MSLASLKAAYGLRPIYKSFYEASVSARLHAGLDDSENAVYFVYFDSDTHYYFEAVKYLTGEPGILKSDYRIKKMTYRAFDNEDSEADQNLLNAFGMPNKFDSEGALYQVGPIRALRSLTLVGDSDYSEIWLKESHPGTQRSDYIVYPNYRPESPKLDSGYLAFHIQNQINDNFKITDHNATFLYAVQGNGFITDSEGREFFHTQFKGRRHNAVALMDGAGNHLKINNIRTSSQYDSEVINGKLWYTGVLNRTDSDFKMDSTVSSKIVKFRHVTESHDSEIFLDTSGIVSSTVQQFPQVWDRDSDKLVTSFTDSDTDGTQYAWKVFNDSDNDGFKARNGLQRGHIGAFDSIYEARRFVLRALSIENTDASVYQNIPYDFDVEAYNLYTDTWRVVDQVRGNRDISFYKDYSYLDDSDTKAQGYRINVLSCQPEFDSEINGLEIKSLRFTIEEQFLKASLTGRGFFVTETDSEYSFTILEETLASGLFLGGGGGGGGGRSGSGGGGGGTVVFDRLKLPAGTYRFKVGKGGTGGAAYNGTLGQQPNGTYGEDTTLVRVNDGTEVVFAKGGDGGPGDFAVDTNDSNRRYYDSEPFGGQGGIASGYSYVSLTVHQGANGGWQDSDDRDVSVHGKEGTTIPRSFYVDPQYFGTSDQVLGSGGASGALPISGDAPTGGTNAGQHGGFLIVDANARNALPTFGGGGAGAYRWDAYPPQYQPGGSGGSGWAYLIFE